MRDRLTTEAGRALLADWRGDPAEGAVEADILAIEAEAAAAERERLRAEVEALPWEYRGIDVIVRVRALLADPAEPEATANPRLITQELAEPEPSDAA